MKILEEKPISCVELASEIAKIKKRDTEVNFRVAKVEEYLNHFVKLKPSEAKQLSAEIEKLQIPRLRPLHINKLIDIMPTSGDDVKLVLDGYPITVTKANCEAIAKVFKEFLKE